MTTAPKYAEPSTRAANAALRAVLPFEDRRDFEDTRRGLIATLPDGVARAASGQIVWNPADSMKLSPPPQARVDRGRCGPCARSSPGSRHFRIAVLPAPSSTRATIA